MKVTCDLQYTNPEKYGLPALENGQGIYICKVELSQKHLRAASEIFSASGLIVPDSSDAPFAHLFLNFAKTPLKLGNGLLSVIEKYCSNQQILDTGNGFFTLVLQSEEGTTSESFCAIISNDVSRYLKPWQVISLESIAPLYKDSGAYAFWWNDFISRVGFMGNPSWHIQLVDGFLWMQVDESWEKLYPKIKRLLLEEIEQTIVTI